MFIRDLATFAVLAFASLVCASAAETEFEDADKPANCTELWCNEGFTLDLDESKDWPQGKYDFTITADGETFHCKSRLPFESCEDKHTRCDTDDITIGLSGCALPAAEHKFYMIRMATIPEQFAVTITHQSGKKYSYSGAVHGQCSYPNGTQCDKTMCCEASAKTKVLWGKK